jgi:hypothetical protein
MNRVFASGVKRKTSFLRLALLSVVLLFRAPLPAQTAAATAPVNGWQDVDPAAYRKHLEELDRLVSDCRGKRTPEACDPEKIGAEDSLRLTPSSAPREVRYEWLHLLLERAGKPEKAPAGAAGKDQTAPLFPGTKADSSPAPAPPEASVDTLLELAHQRLQSDWKQAGAEAVPRVQHASEREALRQILSRREYQGVAETSWKDKLLEKIANWLNEFFSRVGSFGARQKWIGFLLRGLLIGGICVGLVWGLLRIERRSRRRLVPDADAAPMVPSARDWQLWLGDAQAMAARGLWREAIHFVYWASISRLESKRLWPADRTRTPREYLALLPGEDARRPSLMALTQSFERTWYGGREARAEEFQNALDQAGALGVE